MPLAYLKRHRDPPARIKIKLHWPSWDVREMSQCLPKWGLLTWDVATSNNFFSNSDWLTWHVTLTNKKKLQKRMKMKPIDYYCE